MKEDTILSTFLRIRRRLVRMAERIVGDREKAHDVVQDSFVTLWTNYRRMDGEEAERLAFRVVKNRSISRWRKDKPMLPLEEDETDLAANDDRETLEKIENVWQIVEQRLSPLQREILKRHELQGQSVEDIAAETGKSPDDVRKNLGRARIAIRNIYNNEYEDKRA